ncbi:hypothetical protein HanPI659440_Chr11g0429511 [Helianthus annuus]|nr:hypothetical protein HanPI659440_Chr11g0429511 [Helianthus annuus]
MVAEVVLERHVIGGGGGDSGRWWGSGTDNRFNKAGFGTGQTVRLRARSGQHLGSGQSRSTQSLARSTGQHGSNLVNAAKSQPTRRSGKVLATRKVVWIDLVFYFLFLDYAKPSSTRLVYTYTFAT